MKRDVKLTVVFCGILAFAPCSGAEYPDLVVVHADVHGQMDVPLDTVVVVTLEGHNLTELCDGLEIIVTSYGADVWLDDTLWFPATMEPGVLCTWEVTCDEPGLYDVHIDQAWWWGIDGYWHQPTVMCAATWFVVEPPPFWWPTEPILKPWR